MLLLRVPSFDSSQLAVFGNKDSGGKQGFTTVWAELGGENRLKNRVQSAHFRVK